MRQTRFFKSQFRLASVESEEISSLLTHLFTTRDGSSSASSGEGEIENPREPDDILKLSSSQLLDVLVPVGGLHKKPILQYYLEHKTGAEFFHGPTIDVRKSLFANMCCLGINSPQDLKLYEKYVRAGAAGATHAFMNTYRLPTRTPSGEPIDRTTDMLPAKAKGAQYQGDGYGFGDDGEAGAGNRMVAVLREGFTSWENRPGSTHKKAASVDQSNEVDASRAGKKRKARHNNKKEDGSPDSSHEAQQQPSEGRSSTSNSETSLLSMQDQVLVGQAGLCVAVSRWYGGVPLGGKRFSVIGDSASQILSDALPLWRKS